MAKSIYALYYIDESLNPTKQYFYVGRSKDALRRLKQHGYAKKTGHEDKYEFIRDLESKGFDWHMEVLREIPEGEHPPDNERWFVIKLTREGFRLMNMRYGSREYLKEVAEQIKSPNIRNVADVQKDRIRREYLASKRVQRRVLLSTLKTNGIPDVASDKLLPRVLHRRMVRQRIKSVEAGMTLGEIFGLVRAERVFRAIQVKVEAAEGRKCR